MGDPYWANVTLLAGFEDATPNDESPLGQTITLLGSGARSATQYKDGAKSLYVPDSSSGASVPYNAAAFSGTDNFTIEAFVRLTSLTDFEAYPVLTNWDLGNSTGGWYLRYNHNYASTGTNRWTFVIQNSTSTYTVLQPIHTPSVDTWYHVAVDFDGTTYRMYIDGTMIGSAVASYPILDESLNHIGIGTHLQSGAAYLYGLRGYIDEARITSGVARYASDAGFTVPSTPLERGEDYSLSDSMTIEDSFSTFPIVQMIETISMSGLLAVTSKAALSDAFSAYAFVSPTYVMTDALSDTVNVADTLALLPGILLHDYITATATLSPSFRYVKSVSDVTRLVDALAPTLPVVLSDMVSVAIDQVVATATRVIESLRLSETLLPSTFYGKSVTETVALSDALALFLSGQVSDVITVAATESPLHRTYPALADSVTVTEAASPAFILRVTASDRVDMSASEALTMLYNQTVAEGIDIAGAYLSPGDGFTSWAMNTRTGAVSEYSGYEFNSFVMHSNKKYLGASPSGLFELNGDTDDGTDIVSTLRSGFMQWTGTHLGRFKGVYIATRGADDFVLKLETGDGTIYNYAVTTRSMRSTKVHLGKGLRARYFSFELISSGADFDLESLEFVPLVAQRRV